jgi:hypothetical protein
VGRLLSLPSSALDGFRDWDGELFEFLRQPWVGDGGSIELGIDAMGLLGSDATDVITLPRTTDPDIKSGLTELARIDSKHHSRDWYIHPFDQDDQGLVAKTLCSDLREGSLLGVGIVLDGRGEHFTRSGSVRDVVRTVTNQKSPLLTSHPKMKSTLAGPLLRINGGVRVDDGIDLITSARTLQLFQELMSIDARDRAGSTKTYVSKIAALYSPTFVTAIKETIQFLVRRRLREQ